MLLDLHLLTCWLPEQMLPMVLPPPRLPEQALVLVGGLR